MFSFGAVGRQKLIGSAAVLEGTQDYKMAHGPETEELLRIISTSSTRLMLVNLNITSLPELPSGLKELHCQNTRLASLPELPSELKLLDCCNTRLTSLPNLPAGLQRLYCSNTQLTSLPELPSGLQTLYVSNTQLTSLPTLPSGLQVLYCYNTQLSSLPELPSGLRDLYCSNTPLIIQREKNESISDYNRRWAVWREEEVSRKRIQDKHRLLKEEIVIEAWHPRKVERWVDCGVDLACL